MAPPPRARIPVYLLTGFLGSGKTTLLAAWLAQPALEGAAVIVNELGEVGLDGTLLGVTDQAALVSGACVCCTGLPGLEQALEDLFWARLQRRMAFPAVAVETTGLADPAPVVRAFRDHPLLRERYRLEAVIAVAGAPAGAALIDRHPEAGAQVLAAQALVMTKTREATDTDRQALHARFAALNPHAPVLVSNHADLPLDAVLQATGRGNDAQVGDTSSPDLAEPAWPDETKHVETHPHDHPQAAGGADDHDHLCDEHGNAHDHHHAAQASFVPLPQPVARDWLLIRLHTLAGALADDLLRVKGIVALDDGRRCVVQFAPGDRRFDVRPLDEAPGPAASQPGLTVIALHADAERVSAAFLGRGHA